MCKKLILNVLGLRIRFSFGKKEKKGMADG